MSEGAATSVLDASAFLAYLVEEPGADRVEAALGMGAAISAANWAEVFSKLADGGMTTDAIDEAVRELTEQGVLHRGLAVYPLDEGQALEIARLRTSTRRAALSLGDRACLALGRSLGVPVLTADRSWKGLNVGVPIEVIR